MLIRLKGRAQEMFTLRAWGSGSNRNGTDGGPVRGREERERGRDRDRKGEGEGEREGQKERAKETHTYRQKRRETDRKRERERTVERERAREREGQRKREWKRERDRGVAGNKNEEHSTGSPQYSSSHQPQEEVPWRCLHQRCFAQHTETQFHSSSC